MTGRRGMTAIDEMPAGRELDALVAEKVMGWDHYPSKHEIVPAYSTDIAAAWEVVEKMRSDDWWAQIAQDNTDIWDAKLWRGEPDRWFPTMETYGNAPTAPLAICRATLKTVNA